MFDKPLSDITEEDIQRLIDEEISEGQEMEFKVSLPTKNNNDDPWLSNQDRIGNYARNKLLEEIIAFANAYGGIVCIGIAESNDKPAHAESINAIPQCCELAERLILQCRDCIEPQVPLIEACGVVTDNDHSGVVIITVPQSRLAPHRHMGTRECYVRRADRSEKMTMREIQDLTLYTERGMARIETLFQVKKTQFEEKLTTFRKDVSHKIYGVRLTAMPISDIYVNQIHHLAEVKSSILTFQGTFDGRTNINLHFPFSGEGWKPILRGTYTAGGDKNYLFSTELLSNGLIELILLANENELKHTIFPSWFMGMVCNTLNYLHRIRKATGAYSVEYAFEIQINNLGGTLSVDGYGDSRRIRPVGTIKESNIVFPRYSIGTSDSFQQLYSVVESDFWNHFGVESLGDTLQINFDQLIK